MAEEIYPVICPCACTCDFLSKFDPNIYDIENPDTFLKAFFDVVCMEFCDLQTAIMMAKNDFYLWKEMPNTAIVKGITHSVDCFPCKTVVEILSVGDTYGGNDYEEFIDYEVHPCGIHWIESSPYYYAYYNGSGSTGRKSREPATGATYYVTYRCGVRNSKLYDVFGVLVGLIKKDYQTYSDYRRAIKALIMAFLLGPTIAGMKQALSVIAQVDDIKIEESFKTGWILGESICYSEADYLSDMNTNDGTILKAATEEFYFDLDIEFHNSDQIRDPQLITDIVNMIKPAHARCFIHLF